MQPDASKASNRVGRKLRKAADIVLYSGLRLMAGLFGRKPRHRARDRRLLDEQILPRLAQNPRFARVLFVGCDWYTEHVENLFGSTGREYTTIEIDAARAKHGARRHIVAGLSDLGHHFEPGSLDLIVCNGVIGWGLNQVADIERSMAACALALSPGGVLLLGWDEVPEKLPIPIERIEALRSLQPIAPEGFEGALIQTRTYARHTFGFFTKRSPESA